MIDYNGITYTMREAWDNLQMIASDSVEAHFQSPQFFNHLAQTGTRKLSLITARDDDGDIVGISPLLYCNYPFRFMVCGHGLTINLRVALLLGSAPLGNVAWYDHIFAQVLDSYRHGVSAVVLASVPVQGTLWDYIYSAPLVSDRVLIYVAHTELCHSLPLPDTCDEYVAKFSSK